MKLIDHELDVNDSYLLLLGAVRYGLERQSYFVSFINRVLREAAPGLTPEHRAVFVRDILEHFEMCPQDTQPECSCWLQTVDYLRSLDT